MILGYCERMEWICGFKISLCVYGQFSLQEFVVVKSCVGKQLLLLYSFTGFSISGPCWPWRHDAMMPWCHDAMTPWCHDAMVPWRHNAGLLTARHHVASARKTFVSQLPVLEERPDIWRCYTKSVTEFTIFLYRASQTVIHAGHFWFTFFLLSLNN